MLWLQYFAVVATVLQGCVAPTQRRWLLTGQHLQKASENEVMVITKHDKKAIECKADNEFRYPLVLKEVATSLTSFSTARFNKKRAAFLWTLKLYSITCLKLTAAFSGGFVDGFIIVLQSLISAKRHRLRMRTCMQKQQHTT